MKKMKKVLSAVLCLCMLAQNVPAVALAAEGDGLCGHHSGHTAECGYVEAVEGKPCLHQCSEGCATVDVTACVHDHEAEGCVHTTPAEAVACDHVHGEGCGYVAPQEAVPCTFVCEECKAEEKTCTCEDPGEHAPFCDLYVRTYEECLCVLNCAEEGLNEWCEVCYFGGAEACNGGEEEQTPYNYTVSCIASPAAGGTVIGANTYYMGEQVSVTVMPEIGYKLVALTVTDAEGADIQTTKGEDNTYNFTMPSRNVTFTAVFQEDTLAEITGITLTVDGTEYKKGQAVTVDNSTQSVTLRATGTNLGSAHRNAMVYVSEIQYVDNWVVSADGTHADYTLTPDDISGLAGSVHFQHQYSNDGGENWIDSGILVNPGSGVDVILSLKAKDDKGNLLAGDLNAMVGEYYITNYGTTELCGLSVGTTHTLDFMDDLIRPEGYQQPADVTFTVDVFGNITVTSGNATVMAEDGVTTFVVVLQPASEDPDPDPDPDPEPDPESAPKLALRVVDAEGNAITEKLDACLILVEDYENWISNEDSTEVYDLSVGCSYTLDFNDRSDCPDGYLLPEDITFTVGEDGAVTVTSENANVVVENGTTYFVIVLESVPTHQHQWKYEVVESGAALKASCSVGNCKEDGGTLGIGAGNATYDGYAKSPTVYGWAGDYKREDYQNRIDFYRLVGENYVPITTIPTDAGTYKAIVNIDTDKVISVTYTIAKAAAPRILFPTAGAITYGQSLSDVELSVSSNEYGSFQWIDPTLKLDAGNYSSIGLTFKPNESVLMNYDWDSYQGDAQHGYWYPDYKDLRLWIPVTVNKADPEVTASTAISGLIYNGQPQALIKAGTTTGGTVQYSLDNASWSTDIPTGKDAKTYTVYYKVVGGTNYNDVAAQAITVSIAKAKLTIAADDKTAMEGVAMPELTYTVSGLKGSDKLTGNPTLNCDATMSTAGEYEITVSGGDAGANYEIEYVKGKLTVQKEHKVTVSATVNGTAAVSHEKAVEGTEITVTVTPKSGYKMSTLTVKDAAGKSYAVSTDNRGKYYFTMRDADVTVTVTFSKISTADSTNPKTGDDFRLGMWRSIAVISLLGLVAAAFSESRKRKYQR